MISNSIKYVIIDVDGTMTDAGIYYDEHGNELKKFCTKDAAAFFVAEKLKVSIVVLTGRECKATERRMKELRVPFIFQNVRDKYSFLQAFFKENRIEKNEVAYVGDDLNDLHPMDLAGIKACPADSCKEVRAICNYVSNVSGGYGAVRDVFENYLFKDEWDSAIIGVYDVGK